MTNYTNSSDRERLELILNQNESEKIKKSSFFSRLNSLWQHLIAALSNGHEPQIWVSSDRAGTTWWHGYDPLTGRSVTRSSEAEMRVWVEERYYQ